MSKPSLKGISETSLFYVDKDWMMYQGGSPSIRPAAIRASDRIDRGNLVSVRVARRANIVPLS